jgi:predicted metal-dependent phosphotriesterase family hydrolase
MLTSFVPMLKKEGLTDEQIHQIMVENPKNMLRRKVV